MILKRPFARAGLVAAVAMVLLSVGRLRAAEAPIAPALSTLAPVEDLVSQIEDYLKEVEESVEDQEEYEDSVEKIDRYSNSLAVVALAVGLHDQDSPLRKATPALVKASQELAGAKDFAGAKAGVAKIKAALSASGDPSTLKWSKVASLPTLMKQVPLINTRLKRFLKPGRFEKNAAVIAGNSAALVAIGQGSMPNAEETEAPDRVADWFKYCVEMRDAAGALNNAVHARNEDAAKTAMAALQQSCDDCHTIFHKDAEKEVDSHKE